MGVISIKKIIWLAMFSVFLFGCSDSEEVKKTSEEKIEEKKENIDLNKEIEFTYMKKDGYKESKVEEIKINEQMYMINVETGTENQGKPYSEFYKLKEGEWEIISTFYYSNSEFFSFAESKVMKIKEEEKILSVTLIESGRGKIGTVAFYEIKENEVNQIKEIAESGFLEDEITILTEEKIEKMINKDYLNKDMYKEAFGVFYDKKLYIFGYDLIKEESFIEEINDKNLLGDLKFGEGNYVIVYISENVDRISSVKGKFESKVLSENGNYEIITLNGIKNVIFNYPSEYFEMHTDYNTPGIFVDSDYLSQETIMEKEYIEGMESGIYSFVVSHYAEGPRLAFQIHIK